LYEKDCCFFVLAMIFISSLAAQSATNDAQRIVGTWAGEGITLVFNTNGTGTWSQDGETLNFSFGISAAGVLNIVIDGDNISSTLYFSPDGRKMIFLDSIVFQKR